MTIKPIDHDVDISAIARALGSRGGKAAAAKMTPEERSERAKRAGLAQKSSRTLKAKAKKTKQL